MSILILHNSSPRKKKCLLATPSLLVVEAWHLACNHPWNLHTRRGMCCPCWTVFYLHVGELLRQVLPLGLQGGHLLLVLQPLLFPVQRALAEILTTHTVKQFQLVSVTRREWLPSMGWYIGQFRGRPTESTWENKSTVAISLLSCNTSPQLSLTHSLTNTSSITHCGGSSVTLNSVGSCTAITGQSLWSLPQVLQVLPRSSHSGVTPRFCHRRESWPLPDFPSDASAGASRSCVSVWPAERGDKHTNRLQQPLILKTILSGKYWSMFRENTLNIFAKLLIWTSSITQSM